METKLQNQKETKMKTCYQCGGPASKRIIDLELEGVIIKGVPAEVCGKCGEKYFDTKTATFVQEITGFIKNKRTELALPAR